MSLPEQPAGWGDDDLTKYLDNSRHNAFATYSNLRKEYLLLSEIDVVFHKAIEYLFNTNQPFAAFFLLRAHSSFLAGSRLSMSGQVPEGYACLRLALENALYGLYLTNKPESQETWFGRHDSEASKKAMREKFKVGTLFKTLREVNKTAADATEQLYERTIDYGAHPNERALMQILNIDKGEDRVEFKVAYLTEDTPALRLILKTTAQVGICTLDIFRLIFRERFDIVGITDMLNKLRRGL